jgi:hypothetical protein
MKKHAVELRELELPKLFVCRRRRKIEGRKAGA